jgi:hypothetical protein
MRYGGVVIGWGRRYGFSIIHKAIQRNYFLNRHNHVVPGRGVTSLEGQRTLAPIILTVIMREGGVVIGWGRRYGFFIIQKATRRNYLFESAQSTSCWEGE